MRNNIILEFVQYVTEVKKQKQKKEIYNAIFCFNRYSSIKLYVSFYNLCVTSLKIIKHYICVKEKN